MAVETLVMMPCLTQSSPVSASDWVIRFFTFSPRLRIGSGPLSGRFKHSPLSALLLHQRSGLTALFLKGAILRI